VPRCFFVSDLHGRARRYEQLFAAVAAEAPAAVFLGGDLLPGLAAGHTAQIDDFFDDVLVAGFRQLERRLGPRYPRVFLILGNDDPKAMQARFEDAAVRGLWEFVHGRKSQFGPFGVYGYAHIPPTPFQLKDWERYDVSRYVPPGCVSPEEGVLSLPVTAEELRWTTIQHELQKLLGDDDLSRAILLLHGPPHATALDRAALDGQSIDHVPLDLHVGSIAVRRMLEERQPLISLHGHIHESARLMGDWRQQLGRTWALGAAHDGPELALVRFDPAQPEAATRELL
jgi:Icc-related predicted phosphoesterase